MTAFELCMKRKQDTLLFAALTTGQSLGRLLLTAPFSKSSLLQPCEVCAAVRAFAIVTIQLREIRCSIYTPARKRWQGRRRHRCRCIGWSGLDAFNSSFVEVLPPPGMHLLCGLKQATVVLTVLTLALLSAAQTVCVRGPSYRTSLPRS